MNEKIASILRSLEPNGETLLSTISAQIDDEMLRQISEADYGTLAKQHLRALRKIRDRGLIEYPLRWVPGEVLELVRWGEPDDTQAHLMRAFACSVLMRAYPDIKTQKIFDGYNETLIQLVMSLQFLDEEFVRPAISFLAWYIENQTGEFAFAAVALLSMFVHPGCTVVLWEDDISTFASWILELEERMSSSGPDEKHLAEHWLLRTTYHRMKYGKWIRLGNQLAKVEQDRPGGTRIREIGRLLAGDIKPPPKL